MLVAGSLFFGACENDPVDMPEETYRELLLLQVDRGSADFEGGVKYAFPDGGLLVDSIPLSVEFVAPSDIGHLTVRHTPTGAVVFDGSIHYSGAGGSIHYPDSMSGPSAFAHASTYAVHPPLSDIQDFGFFHPLSEGLLDTLWPAVGELEIVASFMRSGARVGSFGFSPVATGPQDSLLKEFFLLYR